MFPFNRFAVAVVGLGLGCVLPGACDSKPPDYLVQHDILRLVPETSTVSSDGGPLYVLLELTRTEENAASIVFAESKGATLSPLPGQGICGGGKVTVAPSALGAAGTGPNVETAGTLILPPSELLADSVRSTVHETGFVLEVPAGDTDVLVVATAFGHTGPDDSCESRGSAVAVASVRITRAKADAATGGAGAQDAGVALAGRGDSGGSPEAGGISYGPGGSGGTADSGDGGGAASGRGGGSDGGADTGGSAEGGT